MTFEEAIDLGVYEFAGFEDDGEAVYTMNLDMAREHCPVLYWAELNSVEEAVADAIEEGYLEREIDLDNMVDYLVTTQKGRDAIKE